jgi:hypothetical protein
LACRHNELTIEAGQGAKDKTLHMLRCTEVWQQTVAMGQDRPIASVRAVSAVTLIVLQNSH